MEWSLKIGEVIVLAVVMRDRAGWMMQRPLPNIRQSTLDQRQHILSGVLIEQPPLAVHRDIDR